MFSNNLLTQKRRECQSLLYSEELLVASEKSAMGSPMNNDSAKKWHHLGLHVRQKEPAPRKNRDVRRGVVLYFV